MHELSPVESSLLPEISEPTSPVQVAVTSKPRIWTIFAAWIAAILMGLIAVLGSLIAVGVVMGVVMGVQGTEPAMIQVRVQEAVQQPLAALLLSLVPFQLGMGMVVLVVAWLSKEPFHERLGLVPPSGNVGRVRMASMAAFTLAAAYVSIIGSALLLGEPPTSPMDASIAQGSWWTITLLSVVLSVIPSLVEEILFRGYIQRRLLKRWSPAVAIGVSTLLFAIIHADSLQHIVGVVPLGLVTGMLAYRTNSVKPGMLVHAVYNVGVIAVGAGLSTLSPMIGEELAGLLLIGAIAVLGLAGLPAFISLVRRAPSEAVTAADLLPPAVEALASQAV